VTQSFSHGRKKIVQVEKRRVLDKIPKSRSFKVKADYDGKLSAAFEKRKPKQTTKNRKSSKARKKTSAQPQRKPGPSFLNSTSAKSKLKRNPESIGAPPDHANLTEFRSSVFDAQSAGMPGNEEIDPPQRTSFSTPSTRYLDQQRKNR
jgi:hypothetical protein